MFRVISCLLAAGLIFPYTPDLFKALEESMKGPFGPQRPTHPHANARVVAAIASEWEF